MNFISYAQNFEDVMLWRALHHVGKGFYIDVGANDPTLYSVTRAFYDHEWSGINLEPVPKFIDRLKEARPRDINLQLGAGSKPGSFPFFDIPDSGLATSDSAVAEMHRKEGWNVRPIQIQVLTLAEICEEHVTGDIHFLKVDVEGAEREVLLGMNFEKWRPWVVVVEATVPMSKQTAHETWEPLLVDADYEFVYFDGLNRFYVAAEHAELKEAFSLPPNVFDGFTLSSDQERLRADEAQERENQARKRVHEMETKLSNARNAMTQLQAELDAAHAHNHALHAQLQEALHYQHEVATIYASTSWRVTRPLRWAGGAVRRIKTELRQALTSPREFSIRVLLVMLRRATPAIRNSPALVHMAKRIRHHCPGFMDRILRRLHPHGKTVSVVERPAALLQNEVPAWGTASQAHQFKTEVLHVLEKHQATEAS